MSHEVFSRSHSVVSMGAVLSSRTARQTARPGASRDLRGCGAFGLATDGRVHLCVAPYQRCEPDDRSQCRLITLPRAMTEILAGSADRLRAAPPEGHHSPPTTPKTGGQAPKPCTDMPEAGNRLYGAQGAR